MLLVSPQAFSVACKENMEEEKVRISKTVLALIGLFLAYCCPAAFAAGAFTNAATVATGSAPRTVVVADFNHDSVKDLAVANEGSNNVTVLLGQGTCTTLTCNFSSATYATGSAPTSIGAGHFRTNGRWDLVVANTNDNSLTILLSRANGTFPVTFTIPNVGPYLQRLAVDDLNNDGFD